MNDQGKILSRIYKVKKRDYSILFDINDNYDVYCFKYNYPSDNFLNDDSISEMGKSLNIARPSLTPSIEDRVFVFEVSENNRLNVCYHRMPIPAAIKNIEIVDGPYSWGMFYTMFLNYQQEYPYISNIIEDCIRRAKKCLKE